jgi:hypothetical protein
MLKAIMDIGKLNRLVTLSNGLYQDAFNGNTKAAIFILETQFGWAKGNNEKSISQKDLVDSLRELMNPEYNNDDK